MRDILPMAARWAHEGQPFAMATVVGVNGSSPREVGASMVVSASGEVFGTVSGGCVDGAVYEHCLEVLGGEMPRVDTFAYSDADAFEVGLTCGGTIEVLVRAVPAGSPAAADIELLAAREQAAIPTRYALVTAGPQLGRGVVCELGDAADSSAIIEVGMPGRLIVVGAVEFAVALARLGAAMGLRVVVVDPRAVFATAARFPGAEVVVAWPDAYLASHPLDARTAVCVLTHDPRIDVPAIRAALASPAGYVGAMGSRRTHEDRLLRLAAAGAPESALVKLRSPIGLDLGGRSADETALSILAEIVADRHGGSGARLSGLSGPVHAGAAPPNAALSEWFGDETLPPTRLPEQSGAVRGGDLVTAPGSGAQRSDACAWLSDAPASR